MSVKLSGIMYKGTAYILKPVQGYRLYRMMLLYYGTRELIKLSEELSGKKPCPDILEKIRIGFVEPEHNWINMGGQLIQLSDVQEIISKIKNRQIKSWQDLHKEYDNLWAMYPMTRKYHGIHCALLMKGKSIKDLDGSQFTSMAKESIQISQTLFEWAKESRAKDYTNDFRKATYRNEAEMDAVLGKLEDNPFINEMKKMTLDYKNRVEKIVEQLS